MKLSIEIKDDNKIATYTADLGIPVNKASEAVMATIEKVKESLEGTFTKEIYEKKS